MRHQDTVISAAISACLSRKPVGSNALIPKETFVSLTRSTSHLLVDPVDRSRTPIPIWWWVKSGTNLVKRGPYCKRGGVRPSSVDTMYSPRSQPTRSMASPFHVSSLINLPCTSFTQIWKAQAIHEPKRLACRIGCNGPGPVESTHRRHVRGG